MSRPVTIKDESILESAAQVFLARGVRATTSEVAAHAGVSEGTVFNRFKSKEELFRRAMQSRLETPAWIESLNGRVGKGEMRETLLVIAEQALEFFRALTPFILLMHAHREEPGANHPAMPPNSAPLRAVRQVAGYFEAEMRLGRLRRSDPEILGRVFLGTMFNFTMFELMAADTGMLPMPSETFLRGFIQFFWHGAEPEAPKPTR